MNAPTWFQAGFPRRKDNDMLNEIKKRHDEARKRHQLETDLFAKSGNITLMHAVAMEALNNLSNDTQVKL